MFGPSSDSSFSHGAPAQAAVGAWGDSGQLVHLRIMAVNRPQLTRGAGVPRSFPLIGAPEKSKTFWGEEELRND